MSRQEQPPPPWLSDRERRRDRDREQRRQATRLTEVFPAWLVMWGTYSRQFLAYPMFRVPRGAIAHSADPGDLAGMMRAVERSAGGRAAASGSPARDDGADLAPGDLALPGSSLFTEIGHVTLAGRVENVRQARRFIAGLLGRDWPRLDDVLTLASEITSNAVGHTASGAGGHFEVTVAVCADGSRVRVQVADQGGSSAPAPGAARDDDDLGLLTGGRGLTIVDVLADEWGHDGDEQGRVVWFEIIVKPETGTAPG